MRKFDYLRIHNKLISSEVLPLLGRLHELEGGVRTLNRFQPDLFCGLVESARLRNTVTFSRLSKLSVTETRIRAHALDKKEPVNPEELLAFTYCDIVTDLNVLWSSRNDGLAAEFEEQDDWIAQGFLSFIDIPTITVTRCTKTSWSPFSVMSLVMSASGDREKDEVSYKERYKERDNQAMVDEMIADFNRIVKIETVDPLLPALCLEMDYSFIQCQRRGIAGNDHLLLLYLLNRAGFSIGNFISLEEMFKERREETEAAYGRSTKAWMSGEGDYTPYVVFLLETLVSAYKALFASLPFSESKRPSRTDSILNFIVENQTNVSKKAIMSALPWISQKSVERSLQDLQKQNKIVMEGKGRTSTYKISEELLNALFAYKLTAEMNPNELNNLRNQLVHRPDPDVKDREEK